MRRAIHHNNRKLEAVIENKIKDNTYQISLYELKKNKKVLEIQGEEEFEALLKVEEMIKNNLIS